MVFTPDVRIVKLEWDLLKSILLFSDEIAAMMGFSGFGKKAKEFDIDTLVEETQKSAIDRNKTNIGKIRQWNFSYSHTFSDLLSS